MIVEVNELTKQFDRKKAEAFTAVTAASGPESRRAPKTPFMATVS